VGVRILHYLWQRAFAPFNRSPRPRHLAHGQIGERAAKTYLRQQGLKFLTANFAGPRGEIDLIFRDRDCLAFVEVKTRSSEQWSRPASAVDRHKRRRLSLTALDYLRRLRGPLPPFRFDIVEVLLKDGVVHKIRHLDNAFPIEHRDYFP
jgi:putative endonuclease